MMKRSFLYVCAGALALAACTNDEVIAPVENSGIAIGFGTVTGPAASRGAVTFKDILQNSEHEFLVTAYQHGAKEWDTYVNGGINEITTTSDNFVMLNQKVAWNNGAWGYDPVKYWPGKVDGTSYGKVTFFGIGRKIGNTNFTFNATTKRPEYIYTTPAVASNQDDLVADVQFDQSWTEGKVVRFQFGHILSKIGFKAKLAASSYANTTVKVTKLIVGYNNVVTKGTYAFNINSTTANDAWTLSSDKFSPSDTSGDIIKSGGVTVNSTDANSPNPLNADDKFLMLIPQTTTNDGDLIINFTYTIETGSSSKETVTYQACYKIPAREYAKGKAYTYTINFDLKTITFDTTLEVSGWDESTSAIVVGL